MITGRIAVLVLGLALSLPAAASFSHDYALSLWIIAENGGHIDISGAPESLTLVSNNIGTKRANQDITITVSKATTLSFDWRYTTSDPGTFKTAGAYWDPFGYLLNGDFIRLSDNKGTSMQNGAVSIEVLAGDVFGFRAQTRDGLAGAAFSRVDNFSAGVPLAGSVPIPPAFGMMAAALGGMYLVRRRSPRVRAA